MRTLKLDGISTLAIWKGGVSLIGIFLAWFLVTEIIGRSVLGYYLPPPSVGADSFEFDTKVYYLEQSIRQRGDIDCLIVGDSMTNDGPDPRLIKEIYQAKTGHSLHCFNFGIPALFLDTSGPLAVALANRFHPKLLIMILSARDFESSEGLPFRHVASTAWAKQNLGEPSFQGWAVNSSYGYRYALSFQYWLTPSNRKKIIETWHITTDQGFVPLYGFGEPRDIVIPPPHFQRKNFSAQEGFNQVLELHRNGINILVIDAPIRPDIYSAYHDDYFQPYVDYMQETLASNAIPFWLTSEFSESIPSKSWYDLQHINESGSHLFSIWMGQKLAENYPPEFFK